MIISRTPFRISFFGGGTDYPDWYREHGGAVLATTIDKYCYLSCRFLPPFFDFKYRVVWSKVENCQSADTIEHPVVRCLLDHLHIDRGVEIHHVGDLPARSGMGSSSAFTVGLLHALYALQGKMVSSEHLMFEAIHIEQNLLSETVGSQDQVSAAAGGFNKITFTRNGEIIVTPIVLPAGRVEELDSHLMLFYTGIVRTASKVARNYVTGLPDKKHKLRILHHLVDESMDLLASGTDLTAFGSLLDEAWQVKRSLGRDITTADVDEVYARAKAAGALGGKLTGAGGGGFLLLFVPPQRQNDVTQELSELVHVPFHCGSAGSQIIFFDPEEDFAAVEAEQAKKPIRKFRELEMTQQPTQTSCSIPYPRPTHHAGTALPQDAQR